MKYAHVKSLEKYHPGYRDRNLLWCKAYFNMINAEPEFEMLCEIDKWRFMAFVMLELQTKNPVPLNPGYLSRKGFDLKTRPISATTQMLHNFIEVVTEENKVCGLEVDKEIDKELKKKQNKTCVSVLEYFNLKSGKNYSLTPERKQIILVNLNKKRTEEQMKAAIDKFVVDDWSDRHKYMDLVYCIGVRNKIDNFEKWFNYKKNNASEYPKIGTTGRKKKSKEYIAKLDKFVNEYDTGAKK